MNRAVPLTYVSLCLLKCCLYVNKFIYFYSEAFVDFYLINSLNSSGHCYLVLVSMTLRHLEMLWNCFKILIFLNSICDHYELDETTIHIFFFGQDSDILFQ